MVVTGTPHEGAPHPQGPSPRHVSGDRGVHAVVETGWGERGERFVQVTEGFEEVHGRGSLLSLLALRGHLSVSSLDAIFLHR